MRGIGPNQRPTALIFQKPRAVPDDERGREYRLRPARARRGAAAAARGGRAAAASGRAVRPGRQAGRCAVRRPAAARRDRPRARGRAAGAAAGRAAIGARPEAAPAHAQRAARDPAPRRRHLHLHHPRSGRGADHVRPRRGDESRRASSRSATRATSTTIRRRCSSPVSSARTMRCPAAWSRPPTARPRWRRRWACCAGAIRAGWRRGRRRSLFIRPEMLEPAGAGENGCEAEVAGLAYRRQPDACRRSAPAQPAWRWPRPSARRAPPAPGDRMALRFSARDAVVLPAGA